jgi:hypothetical protein
LRLEHATAALLATTESLALLLHDLADLHRCVKELGCATVEADGLALVELTLSVVVGDALLLARLLETKVCIVSPNVVVFFTLPLFMEATYRL